MTGQATGRDLACRWCHSQTWWITADAVFDPVTEVVTIPQGGVTCHGCGMPWAPPPRTPS